MWNVNAVAETDREERRRRGADGPWVSASAPVAARWGGGGLQEGQGGLCSRGLPYPALSG